MSKVAETVVGSGSQATVTFGTYNGKPCAIKTYSNDDNGMGDSRAWFNAEKQALYAINSPGVIKILGHDDGKTMKLYLEQGICDLHTWIHKNSGTYPYCLVKNVMEQLIGGLKDMQALGFVHRDIKPGNIIVMKNMRVCIADLGLVCKIGTPVAVFGTPSYRDPVLNNKSFHIYTGSEDVYSLSCVFHSLIAGSSCSQATMNSMYNNALTMGKSRQMEIWADPLTKAPVIPVAPPVVPPTETVNYHKNLQIIYNVVTATHKHLKDRKSRNFKAVDCAERTMQWCDVALAGNKAAISPACISAEQLMCMYILPSHIKENNQTIIRGQTRKWMHGALNEMRCIRCKTVKISPCNCFK